MGKKEEVKRKTEPSEQAFHQMDWGKKGLREGEE